MILGTYTLTVVREDTLVIKQKHLVTYDEVMLAYESLPYHWFCKISLYIRLPDHGRVETTAGRLIFNNAFSSQNCGNTKREDGTYLFR